MKLFSKVRKTARRNWRLLRPIRRKTKLEFLRFLLWITPSESQRIFLLTLVVGALCGLVAVLFHLSILKAENLLIDNTADAQSGTWSWMLIATPILGGVISGLLLYYIVPGARGSGIPQVKTAYEIKGGRIPFGDVIGKFFISSIQIGSGASLGREGPTVHICGGVADVLGRAASLSQENLRRLMPVGAAAGIAAAFNAPIAAVTFTIEEIVGDLDQTVLSGVIVAAAIAAAIERSILGEHPVFTITQNFGLRFASSLIFYAVLGIAAAVASLAFTESLLGIRKWFGRVRILPGWMKPAAGGLVTGTLAAAAIYFFHTGGVTGGGYDTLSVALSGSLPLRVMAALFLFKLIATVFSYSSGGAGGIFAPALFIGGMLGGTVGLLDVSLFHHPADEVGAFALVGMGAVFAGIVRAPITSVLIIFEMTGSYGLILPLMIANMTAYAIAKHFRPLAVYEALLEQDGIFLPRKRKSSSHLLEEIPVSRAMTTKIVSLESDLTVDEAMKKIRDLGYAVYPVVDDENICIGSVTRARLERNIAESRGEQLVSTIAGDAVMTFPDRSLSQAILQMNEAKVIKLFVVAHESLHELVGMVTMSDIIRIQAEVFARSSDHQRPTVTVAVES
jgi:CIC family chloride channel protein